MLLGVFGEPVGEGNGTFFRIYPWPAQVSDFATPLTGEHEELYDDAVRISLLLGCKPDLWYLLGLKDVFALLWRGYVDALQWVVRHISAGRPYTPPQED